PTTTSSATSNPTSSATPAPTSAGAFALAGGIHYFSTGQPVNAATVQLATGAPAAALTMIAQTQTDGTGQFLFTGLGSDSLQVQPQKMGDVGSAITPLDAVYMLQAALGLRTLSAAQLLTCDVSGNGTVGALDAALILQYSVGLISSFPAARTCGSDWAFMPAP